MRPLACAALLVLAAAAHAAEPDETRCTDRMEAPDIRVGACSRLIESGRFRNDAMKLGTWYFNRGHAHRSNREDELAAADYGRTLEVLPQATNAANSRGDIRFKQGKYREAAEDFALAIKLEPENGQALNNLGLAQTHLRQYEAAIDSFTRALATAQNWADPYENRAYVLLQLGRHDAALADASKAVEIDVSRGFAYRLRGEALYATAKYHESIFDFDRAVQFRPQDAYAYLGRALSLHRLKETARARKDVETVQKLAPDNAWIANRLCYQLALGDLAKEALPHCDRAVGLSPQDPEARDSRGFAYLLLGREKEAVAEYNETLTRNPKHAYAMFGRCVALVRLKQARDAEADCTDARGLDPEVEAFFARRGLKAR